jgi:hypothetical protein
VLFAVAIAVALTETGAQSPTAPVLVGRAFGDSSVSPRILALDPVSERATISARKAKHVVVLAVVPGREIEVIAPGASTKFRVSEKNAFGLSMRRIDDSPVPMDAADDARARLAYDRCMTQARATARRIEQQRRTVRRDSTGKEIPSESRGTGDADQLQRLESSCDRLADAPKRKQNARYLPARTPAERYLVVLASDAEISLTDLYARLATLTAVAPDAATTIEAIAAGLYVGVKEPWGGYFVAW